MTGQASAASESAIRLARIPAAVRHIHLIGIAGSAMAALAGMLVERGYRVTGSDNQLYEPTASLLRRLRIDIRGEFGAKNLDPPPDLAVVGNVIPRANPEAQALLASPIPFLSMPEAIARFFLRDRRVLMVAGTHGKTTSTAMLAQVLHSLGRDPSMLVGGVALNFGSNYRLGSGAEFVIEGDEYDTAFFDKGPKFLHYHPHGTILTAVEFDHADIYRDLDHVKSAFRALAEQLGAEDVLVVCADTRSALEVTGSTRAKRLTFGLAAGDYRATDIRLGADGARFTIEHRGKIEARDVHLPIGGRMNVANALGAFALLREFGLDAAQIVSGLASFKGVARRQQVIGEVAGITVVDDFAHHPTAVRATLDAIAGRFPNRRLMVAFEPRSNTTRRKVFQSDFTAAFDGAQRVFFAPVYFKDNDPIAPDERLSTVELAGAINVRRGSNAAVACSSTAEVLAQMLDDLRAGDVAVVLSNGPFDSLPSRLLNALSERGSGSGDRA